jgi:hypothetical protein
MRTLLVMALVFSAFGAGCGGCVDDEKPKESLPPQQADKITHIRRQVVQEAIFGEAGAPPAAPAGDP